MWRAIATHTEQRICISFVCIDNKIWCLLLANTSRHWTPFGRRLQWTICSGNGRRFCRLFRFSSLFALLRAIIQFARNQISAQSSSHYFGIGFRQKIPVYRTHLCRKKKNIKKSWKAEALEQCGKCWNKSKSNKIVSKKCIWSRIYISGGKWPSEICKCLAHIFRIALQWRTEQSK